MGLTHKKKSQQILRNCQVNAYDWLIALYVYLKVIGVHARPEHGQLGYNLGTWQEQILIFLLVC